MSSAPETSARWQSHPVRAALIRAAAVVIPVLASVAAGAAVSVALPAPRTFGGVVTQWVVVLTVSTVVALLVERLTRRLLPLATLLKLSMLFPDKAPSRFKVARKVAGTKALAAELERARRAGVHGDRQQAAETILSLVGMLGDYDSRTRGHSERTQLFVTMLADEMKLKAEDRDKLVWAALVHDIGKLRVPTEVLNKPGKPDDDEWRRLQAHPAAGATICSPLQEWLGPWWHAIEQHHERFDGGGYPHGLAGQEISLAARIVSVADSYEVMTAARPYKRAMSATAARAELARCAGTQFDPVVVRAFLSISLGRLRWAAGPLSWLAQLPILQPISNLGPHVAPVLGQVAGAAVGVAAAAGALLGLGLAPVAADEADEVVAQEERPVQRDDDPSPAPTGTPTGTPLPSPSTSPTAVPSPARSTTTVPAPVRPGPSTTEPTPVESTPSPAPTVTPTPQPGPTNHAPVARDDVATTSEDAGVDVDVLTNDTDDDSDTVTATLVSAPTHGTASLATGVVSYVPDPDWSGTDAIGYQVTDPDGATSTATVTLTVTPLNDAPAAADDTATTTEDTGVDVDVLTNDTDPDGDALTATITTAPTGGTATLTGGTLTYTPDPDWSGTDAVGYTVTDPDGATSTATVTLTVTPLNDAPVAADDTATTTEDTGVDVDVLTNDTDPDGDTLTATITTAPTGGTATLTGGTLTYTPDPDRNGTDTVGYTVTDPDGATSTATVTLTVTPRQRRPRRRRRHRHHHRGHRRRRRRAHQRHRPRRRRPHRHHHHRTHRRHRHPGRRHPDLHPRPGLERHRHRRLHRHRPRRRHLHRHRHPHRHPRQRRPHHRRRQLHRGGGPAAHRRPAGQRRRRGRRRPHRHDGGLTRGGGGERRHLHLDASEPRHPDLHLHRVGRRRVQHGHRRHHRDRRAARPSRRCSSSAARPVRRGALSPTAPGAAGDWDGDGSPGLTIEKSSMDEDEDQVERFHEWDYTVPAGGLALDGPVRLELSSRTRGARPRRCARGLLDLAVQLQRGRHVVRPAGRGGRRARRPLEPRVRAGRTARCSVGTRQPDHPGRAGAEGPARVRPQRRLARPRRRPPVPPGLVDDRLTGSTRRSAVREHPDDDPVVRRPDPDQVGELVGQPDPASSDGVGLGASAPDEEVVDPARVAHLDDERPGLLPPAQHTASASVPDAVRRELGRHQSEVGGALLVQTRSGCEVDDGAPDEGEVVPPEGHLGGSGRGSGQRRREHGRRVVHPAVAPAATQVAVAARRRGGCRPPPRAPPPGAPRRRRGTAATAGCRGRSPG